MRTQRLLLLPPARNQPGEQIGRRQALGGCWRAAGPLRAIALEIRWMAVTRGSTTCHRRFGLRMGMAPLGKVTECAKQASAWQPYIQLSSLQQGSHISVCHDHAAAALLARATATQRSIHPPAGPHAWWRHPAVCLLRGAVAHHGAGQRAASSVHAIMASWLRCSSCRGARAAAPAATRPAAAAASPHAAAALAHCTRCAAGRCSPVAHHCLLVVPLATSCRQRAMATCGGTRRRMRRRRCCSTSRPPRGVVRLMLRWPGQPRTMLERMWQLVLQHRARSGCCYAWRHMRRMAIRHI